MSAESACISESDTDVRFIVEGVTFEFKREQILMEIEESFKKSIQDKMAMPNWVTGNNMGMLQNYFITMNYDLYKQHSADTALLIQTLRLTDYLGMLKFQQKFIAEVITPSININNCVVFLQETHRKLKNQQNGSQCWYSLLNSSITFLAMNLREVFKLSSDKLKKLHEKILNEILDRAIRNGNVEEQMIFQLVMESRKALNVHSLCQALRVAIEHKKINPKIHAKLSWKLQDVANIKDKKTKNFKFLDLDWLLEASRSANDELIVKLTYCGVEGRCEIGAFYVKVLWWVESKSQQKYQEKIRINYILMNKRQQFTVLALTPKQQVQLGKSKIQLSIFCCLDQIYTFTLNYLAKNHEKVEVEERKLTAEELTVIIMLLKEKKSFSSAIRFIKYLTVVKGSVPKEIFNDIPLSQLTPYEIDFIQKANGQRPIDFSSYSVTENSEVRSVASQSRRSEERPESRGRLRKIFASSPSRSVAENTPLRYEDILRISDLKNYFVDKSHPYYDQL